MEEFGTPGAVFLLMLIVGIETRGSKLKESLGAPRLLTGGILGQLILIPLAALLLLAVATPSETAAIGLLLVAISPAGAISNYYVYLTRGNTELSILLTATGSFLSFLTIPLLRAIALPLFPDVQFGADIPLSLLMGTLFGLTVVPITVGMGLRWLFPGAVERSKRAVRLGSMALLAALVLSVAAARRDLLRDLALESFVLSVAFTLVAMAAGYSLAALLGGGHQDRLAFSLEFPCRNFAIALLLAIAMNQLDFAAFGVVLFVVQAVLITVSTGVYQWLRA